MKRLALALLIASQSLLSASPVQADANDLPTLGDSASGVVSLQQEHDLGRNWLRQLRASAKTIKDPLAVEFLENMAYRLIPHSGAQQSEFEFVIIDKAELNAFAVPGGIIGINLGIMLFAEDEDELAAVLAHELGHLSQRHFARQLERASQQEPVAIATLLASILLIALSDNPDAGIAGIMAGQAASIQDQLAYSRSWEREADRLGMKTLVEAGYDPNAMPGMFTQMMAANRMGGNPPEFLLTHPLTMNRVADAGARAGNYPAQPREVGFDFMVLKDRARIRYQLTPEQVIPAMTAELQSKDAVKRSAARLILAEQAFIADDYQTALKHLDGIDNDYQNDPATTVVRAQTLHQLGNSAEAIQLLEQRMQYYPGSYQLIMAYATILDHSGKVQQSTDVLRKLAEDRPGTPEVWYQLAQSAADARQNMVAYHANAEYLYLNGQQNQAIRQMDLAIKEAGKQGNFQRQEALKERLRQIAKGDRKF